MTEIGIDSIEDLQFNDAGLIPVIAQDASSGEVLMFAWMNLGALRATLDEGRMVYWSRSRSELWRKGDTSGNTQHWSTILYDCDADVLLAMVHQEGPACATGQRSCFYRTLPGGESPLLSSPPAQRR